MLVGPGVEDGAASAIELKRAVIENGQAGETRLGGKQREARKREDFWLNS
jgi:hypothetical protein